MFLYPNVKLITVHDSIVFSNKMRNEIENIFEYELNREFNINI